MAEIIFKPIPSKPGMVAYSNGMVKLPPIKYIGYNGGVITKTPKPVLGTKTRASKNARHFYYGLYNKRFGNMKVHRLVCEAFHGPAPFPRAVVIHRDEDSLNNRPENLKWGTQKENLNAPGFIQYCKSRTGSNSPTFKARSKIAPTFSQQ